MADITAAPEMSEERPPIAPTPGPKPQDLQLPEPNSPAKYNESAALQIVSPGLPQLSSNMLDTVKRSRSIEAQQRNLILERMRGLSAREPASIIQQVLPRSATAAMSVLPQHSGTGLTDEMNTSSIGSFPQVKGLKRKRAPPPLAIPNARTVSGPEIKSAPLYYAHPYQQEYVPHPHARQHLVPVPVPGYRYPPVARFAPHRRPLKPRVFYLDPPVTTAQNRYRVRFQQAREATDMSSATVGESEVVMDVFRDERQTKAPMAAQPLSAQRATFDLDEKEDASEEANQSGEGYQPEEAEAPEATETTSDTEDVESKAIEDEATPGGITRPPRQLKGEIKIDNDVYMYDLPLTGDFLNDKRRYLSLCQTAWDEFAKTI
ncbi:unnamed protein product [Kuraishia capsulata CBS 1993]|uniref:Uncharacterized protein n=1 Tax=Kuraishia capsulata CBS 1993 TaxID=1382522 RepID=W6MJR8_9ASCO|nr:uncharacterized protein KUCA_T00000733001 [Kuraishia capsulata CBS 1993]CDK24767.1 unnamed protein product [Kuraishia capsulata CBS 1993]